jgi:hypothetical protein
LKFSNQTNCVEVPKASSTSSDWYSACVAGRKKNTSVITICGRPADTATTAT